MKSSALTRVEERDASDAPGFFRLNAAKQR